MKHQIEIDPQACADTHVEGSLHEVAVDIAYQRLAIVNAVFLGLANAPDRRWILVDTGVGGSAHFILAAAERRFGRGSRPGAIVLTHGHFDHVGSLATLADVWDAPIYAHELERPFLDGTTQYPPPDPTVGGGLMAALSGFYPRGPIDVRSRLFQLENDRLPIMDEWTWLHTPGHSPGHVSFWRPRDRSLIAGDAVITTNQESAYAVLRQTPEIHGPPTYYTPDWKNAQRSVETIASLEPERIVSGHGRAMAGPALRKALVKLSANFDEIAVPARGRYVDQRHEVAH